MTTRSAEHATFVIERTYDAPPARVFAAWSSREAKSRWFGAPDVAAYTLDFRVGGGESNRGGPHEGTVYTYESTYHEIVPDERIVYSYTMDAGETRISVSVATVEFAPAGGGTTLTLTEQGVFLDEGDTPAVREGGTKALLDALGDALG
jgi:uncharacterized protein YndB with AHSA1/START domain